MKYQNIIFDFGNVIGSFNADYILGQYTHSKNDFSILAEAIFQDWPALDSGAADYDQTALKVISSLPDYLQNTARDFYATWFQYVNPLTPTWDFIHELKQNGYFLYLLSNASTRFADVARDCYPILNEFDGIVFSAPLKLAKPDPAIYQYLFHHFHLDPKTCFFIDDLAENISAGQALGMDGMVFHDNIDIIKEVIGF